RLLKEAGITLRCGAWAMSGIPTALAIVALIYTVFGRLYPPRDQGDSVTPSESPSFGPLSRGEWVTALCFALAITGWVVPGVLKATGSELAGPVGKALPSGAVAMLAASVLFLFKDDSGRQAVLPWEQARKIDWGLIMLFGGGISLGTQMFETGLARELGKGFIALTGVSDVWTLTGVAIVFTIFFTEVCSNTATSNMVIPLVIGITSELGVSPVPPSLGVGLAASCAFMMPIATGPNAIVYGTGHVPLPAMIRVGVILNLMCAVIVFTVVRLLVPAYGWM
ncbi:MAG: SLC13 family permease, partial [Myxococcales bacterium]|nr:SLC13 family permease [Myxococcales bacterium]